MNVRNTANVTGGNRGSNDTFLYMAQAGIKSDAFKAALGYFHYTSTANQIIVVDQGVGGTNNRDQDYHIFNALVEFKAGPVKLFAEGNLNVGADSGASHIGGVTGDEDMAYILGVSGKVGKKVKLSYDYRHIEANSQPAVLVDSDFGQGGDTNYKGHVLGIKYAATKNLSIGFKALLSETIEDNANQQDDNNIYQLDFVYKF